MCVRDVITLAPLEYEMIIVALSFLFYHLADMARSSLPHLDRRYMVRIGGGGGYGIYDVYSREILCGHLS